MNRKKFLLSFVFLFGAVCTYAVTVDDVTKAAQLADLQARAARQETDKNFAPQLTARQLKKIPGLLKGVKKRLHKAGYISLTEADVTDGVWLYFKALNMSRGYYTSEDITEMMDGAGIEMPEGDFREHALVYALAAAVPAEYRHFAYDPQDYPEVVEEQRFYALCQENMDSIYALLEELQRCDWDRFKSVMCNVM